MIGIVGYMSGGKSYTSVEYMLGMFIRGHRVVTNIRLNCQAVTSYVGVSCLFWKRQYFYLAESAGMLPYNSLLIDDYESWPCGSPRGSSDYDEQKVFIFLDEVSSLFDSMVSSADGGIQAVATWARHSEKRGQILYLIMQFPSELHKRLRVHITSYIECTNTNSVKIPMLGIGLPWMFRNMIIRRQLMPDLETVIGSASWSRLNPDIFKCYNTGQIVVGHQHSNFKPLKPTEEILEQRFVEMLTRLSIVLIFVWIVLTGFIFYWLR